ncbi:hypothetical protein BKA69DRAFT_746406 [Paraphysoderma sedebokerense]|nr:hypothetical protein BKA69DRAFT_746406 [Paraphysoderma sedebokerense]
MDSRTSWYRFYALPSTIYSTLQCLCKYDHYQKSYNMLYLPASKSRSLSLDSKIELPKGYYRGVLTADNVDEVLSTATLSYDPSYIRQLITCPPYRHLQSAIFYTPNSPDTVSDNAESTETQSKAVPIAWALSHVDLSLGLVYTNPSHRRLGFARDCIVSVISKQLDYFRNVAEQFHSEDLDAQKEWDQLKETQQSLPGRCKRENGLEDRGMFCFVDVHNEKSRQLMKSIGFEVIEGMEYFWGYTTDGLVTKNLNGDNGNQDGLNGGLVG